MKFIFLYKTVNLTNEKAYRLGAGVSNAALLILGFFLKLGFCADFLYFSALQ
jgi:hypothetical protein